MNNIFYYLHFFFLCVYTMPKKVFVIKSYETLILHTRKLHPAVDSSRVGLVRQPLERDSSGVEETRGDTIMNSEGMTIPAEMSRGEPSRIPTTTCLTD